MKRLLAIALMGALCSFPAYAGGNKNNTAVGVGVGVATGGAGGAATSAASAGSGDTTVIGMPRANAASAVPAYKCAMSKNRNILGIIAWGDSYESKNCLARLKMRVACSDRNLQAECTKLKADFVHNKFDEDYAPPVDMAVIDKKKYCEKYPHEVECF